MLDSNSSTGPDVDALLDVETARGRHRLRVRLVSLLTGCVPPEYEISAACSWTPTSGGDTKPARSLRSDVVVHHPAARGGQATHIPVLCVDIANPTSSPCDRNQGRACARVGVDHYWYLNPEAGCLETYVCDGDELRHAETFTATSSDEATCTDFGVGLAHLDLPTLLTDQMQHYHRHPRHVINAEPAS